MMCSVGDFFNDCTMGFTTMKKNTHLGDYVGKLFAFASKNTTPIKSLGMNACKNHPRTWFVCGDRITRKLVGLGSWLVVGFFCEREWEVEVG